MRSNQNNPYANLPVLVTGGAGFIGSHLVEALVNHGARVTVLDNLSTGLYQNLAAVENKIQFIEGSITDQAICARAAQGQSHIFHLAAVTSVPASLLNPAQCHEVNVTGTANLLEAARQQGVKRFVFSSSSAVYGDTTAACSEDSTPCQPLSPYGYSKLIGELYTKQYAELFLLQTVSLRYFNVYGPRQRHDIPNPGIVAILQHALKHNLPITLNGNGTQQRDFVPVAKIVEANLNLGRATHAPLIGETFNIATGSSISLLALIEQFKADSPGYNQPLQFAPARAGDITISRSSIAKYEEYMSAPPLYANSLRSDILKQTTA